MKTEQENDKPCTYILLMAQNDDIVTANDNREEKNGWNTPKNVWFVLFSLHTLNRVTFFSLFAFSVSRASSPATT